MDKAYIASSTYQIREIPKLISSPLLDKITAFFLRSEIEHPLEVYKESSLTDGVHGIVFGRFKKSQTTGDIECVEPLLIGTDK